MTDNQRLVRQEEACEGGRRGGDLGKEFWRLKSRPMKARLPMMV